MSINIDTRFDHNVPTPERAARHVAVRAACKQLAAEIVERTPVGREQSLAITALEETLFWANAAIAREGKE